MKAIMISIRPQYVAKILNGEKTIEIRKMFPSDYVGWVYFYCIKTLPLLLKNKDSGKIFINKLKAVEKDNLDRLPHIQKFNGKVVAKFWCNKVERLYEYQVDGYGSDYEIASDTLKQKELLKECCLTYDQLNDYLGDINNGKAIHITKLEIFDKPKEISEFSVYSHKVDGIGYDGEEKTFRILKPLTRAPQNYCYIEV